PRRIDESVGGDDLVRVQQQAGEQGALLVTTEVERLSLLDHLERAEDAKLHRRSPRRLMQRAANALKASTGEEPAAEREHRRSRAWLSGSMVTRPVCSAVGVYTKEVVCSTRAAPKEESRCLSSKTHRPSPSPVLIRTHGAITTGPRRERASRPTSTSPR